MTTKIMNVTIACLFQYTFSAEIGSPVQQILSVYLKIPTVQVTGPRDKVVLADSERAFLQLFEPGRSRTDFGQTERS
jgi:hypothetical protein